MTGCQSASNSAWESVKTAGRYMNKGLHALWGSDEDSKLIASEDEFVGPDSDDYIPLQDTDLNAKTMTKEKPRLKKSTNIPNIQEFQTPSDQSIFRKIHFQTDDHVVYDKKDLVTVARIANFLKSKKKAYLIVEGHCDERASSAYNMALGMRRANHIRVLLSKQGVDVNRIYTVSCGKEKPMKTGHTAQDHWLNRRVEFKIHKH